MEKLQNTNEQLLKDIKNLIAKEGNGRVCVGFQQLSVGGSALHLTIPLSSLPAQSCTITCTNAAAGTLAARYRMDGTAPTTAIGEVMGDLDTLEITNSTNLSAVQFISISGTTVLNIHYYA